MVGGSVVGSGPVLIDELLWLSLWLALSLAVLNGASPDGAMDDGFALADEVLWFPASFMAVSLVVLDGVAPDATTSRLAFEPWSIDEFVADECPTSTPSHPQASFLQPDALGHCG